MSPGWVTDLAVLELTGSTVDDRGDHLVVRTPANPGYHWGNCLLVTESGTVDDAARWYDAFRLEFPTAGWVAIGLPRLPRDPQAWNSRSIDLEQNDVLTTTTVPRASALPAGYTVRRSTATTGSWPSHATWPRTRAPGSTKPRPTRNSCGPRSTPDED